MALINIIVPQFPNVPIAPGVPAVLRDAATSLVENVASLVNDVVGFQLFGIGDTWGLFDTSGAVVIESDSVKAVEIEAEYTVPDYPLENGGFESYNKVQRPKEFTITFLKGGRVGERTQFLQEVEQACASLDVFVLVTPEVPYASVNPTRYSMRRTASEGKTLLTVEVHAREVRVSVNETFSNTARPSGASVQNGGTVQAQTPDPATTAATAAALNQIKAR